MQAQIIKHLIINPQTIQPLTVGPPTIGPPTIEAAPMYRYGGTIRQFSPLGTGFLAIPACTQTVCHPIGVGGANHMHMAYTYTVTLSHFYPRIIQTGVRRLDLGQFDVY